MSYFAIKHIHLLTALITAVLFMLRGYWMLAGSALLQRQWARIVPHINDTALLASAIALAVWSGQYPFQQDWLTAKVLLLVAYIAAGLVALKFGKTRRVRATAFVLGLVFLGCIFKIALTRQIF